MTCATCSGLGYLIGPLKVCPACNGVGDLPPDYHNDNPERNDR